LMIESGWVAMTLNTTPRLHAPASDNAKPRADTC
jgi:hypothetical protein